MNEVNQENLLAKYGYCVIPKNTILYRGFENTNISDCMFFALQFFVAGAGFGKTNIPSKIHLWKTKKDVKVIFLITRLNAHAWAESAIPLIYEDVFPDESSLHLTDLDIKQTDFNRRVKFINKLHQEFNIDGWFSSLEGRIELEICLFGKKSISEKIELIEQVSEDNDLFVFKNSLRKLKLFPGEGFVKLTRKAINKHYTFYKANPYQDYRKKLKIWYEDGLERGLKINDMKEEYYNLRHKLKI